MHDPSGRRAIAGITTLVARRIAESMSTESKLPAKSESSSTVNKRKDRCAAFAASKKARKVDDFDKECVITTSPEHI